MGDFAELRSRWTLGRSARVAAIAGGAAQACGLPAAEVTLVRREALVADLGSVGVPSGIWESSTELGVAQLPISARVLAAADVWTALLEDRPHRPAHTQEQARDALRAEVERGRLDRAAVEVLQAIARGFSNRQVATRLGISAKTVGHHVEHIYAKIGVTTRPAAALFAVQHDLLHE